MSFGIPPWALGVGAVLTVVFVLQVLAARLMPHGHRRRSMKEMIRGDTAAELEELQARLGEMDELKRRMGELEERVDFAERLLARQRESERLPP